MCSNHPPRAIRTGIPVGWKESGTVSRSQSVSGAGEGLWLASGVRRESSAPRVTDPTATSGVAEERSCTSRAGTAAVALWGDAKLSEDMSAARLRSQAANQDQRTSPPRRTREGVAPPSGQRSLLLYA